jgi:nucleotide-binding universal stress UspA family protein
MFAANDGREGLFMFGTILVPLDGSPFAEQALPWALSLARRSHSALTLVRGHVLYALLEPAAAWGPYDPGKDAERRQEEQLYLDGTARWLQAATPVPITTAVVFGTDANSILKHATQSKADLIVMSTHGRGPAGRLFFGSVADQVVRRSMTPVLLIRADESAPHMIPEPVVERVLVPLDGSPLAEQVLATVADLASVLQADCTLMQVVVAGHDSHARGADREAEARSYLDSIARRLGGRGRKVDSRVVVAHNAAEAILTEVRAHDLITLATHGRGGISRILLGSVADVVVRAAPCPVLVYRPNLFPRDGGPLRKRGSGSRPQIS